MDGRRLAKEITKIAQVLLAVHEQHHERLKEMVKTRPDIPVMDGPASHEEGWHNKSVLGHIEWTKSNADKAYAAAGIDVREIAALHDIGKIIDAKVKPDGTFSFKGHEITGADYLKNERSWHTLMDEEIEVIRHHGSMRKGIEGVTLTPEGLKKLAVLELCDEFGKWSQESKPPKGDETKMLGQRQAVVDGAKKLIGDALVEKIIKAFAS